MTPAATPPDQASGADTPFRDPGFWLAACVGTLVSLLATGYVAPQNNNVFHLPIVAGLAADPSFAADPFVQSLGRYASGFWMILSGSARWIDPGLLFFGGFVASRLLALVGFLACADLLGVARNRERLVFALIVSTTFLMREDSFAGGGGLFIDYFTHSELANGLFLLALRAAVMARAGTAIALTGAIFFVNAFFGVWTAVVVAAVLAAALFRCPVSLRALLISAAPGVVVALALAYPVVRNVLGNPDFGRPLDFDYADFLAFYFPGHVLFAFVPTVERIALVLLIATGFAALARIGDRGRGFGVALAAAVGLYGIGIAAPHLTHAPSVLNLHLLRSSTLIHEMVALFAGVWATRLWFVRAPDGETPAEGGIGHWVLAPVGAAVVAMPGTGDQRLLLLGALFGLVFLSLRRSAARADGAPPRPSVPEAVLRAGAILTLVVAVVASERTAVHDHAHTRGWLDEWAAVGAWARRNTETGATFLVPVANIRAPGGLTEDSFGAMSNTAFEATARRPVWVDFKRGAAVMWSPSYHAVWRARLDAVMALNSTEARLAYARAEGIGWVIEIGAACRGPATFRTARICVIAVEPATAVADASR